MLHSNGALNLNSRPPRSNQMKLGICQELFEGWDWERQMRFIAETGYAGVELAPFTLSPHIADVPDETLTAMRGCADEHGLTIIGLHWLLARTQGMHLTCSDDEQRAAAARYLVRLGTACARLGGNVMVFGSPRQRNLEPGMDRGQALENACGVFRRALPSLADQGVQLCIEPLATEETNFINTCAEAVELLDMVDAPNFHLQQDVKAMLGAEEDSVPVLIERYADRVGHVHVNDANLLGPGMGETDFLPILRALRDSKYDGWVSVEVFDYRPGAEHIARESLRYLRETLERLDA